MDEKFFLRAMQAVGLKPVVIDEKTDTDFPRQPDPVTVMIWGTDPRDITYWKNKLMRAAEFKGDMTQVEREDAFRCVFKIYPRAVND